MREQLGLRAGQPALARSILSMRLAVQRLMDVPASQLLLSHLNQPGAAPGHRRAGLLRAGAGGAAAARPAHGGGAAALAHAAAPLQQAARGAGGLEIQRKCCLVCRWARCPAGWPGAPCFAELALPRPLTSALLAMVPSTWIDKFNASVVHNDTCAKSGIICNCWSIERTCKCSTRWGSCHQRTLIIGQKKTVYLWRPGPT